MERQHSSARLGVLAGLGCSPASGPEGRVERGEQHQRHRCRAQQVPRPGAEKAQQGPLTRRPPEEHVVGTGEGIDQPDHCGVGEGDGEYPWHGARSRRLAEADHQEQGREHDAHVAEHVLPEDEVREADRQIGGEETLEGARQTPEVGQFDQHRTSPEARGRRYQHRGVTEGEGKRGLGGPVARHQEPDRVAAGGEGEDGPHHPGHHFCPGARAHPCPHARTGTDTQTGDDAQPVGEGGHHGDHTTSLPLWRRARGSRTTRPVVAYRSERGGNDQTVTPACRRSVTSRYSSTIEKTTSFAFRTVVALPITCPQGLKLTSLACSG